jgi:hypothetical protein
LDTAPPLKWLTCTKSATPVKVGTQKHDFKQHFSSGYFVYFSRFGMLKQEKSGNPACGLYWQLFTRVHVIFSFIESCELILAKSGKILLCLQI